MSKQIVIDNEFITMWYHPEEKIVHHQFHKRTIYGNNLKEFLNKGVDLLKVNSACKWLSDDRIHVVLTQEDLLWGVNNWLPRVVDAGWKYWAIVKPIEEIGKMSLQQLSYEYKQKGIIVEYFDDVEKAFEWLKVAN